ncbi:MAG: hypothetical protein DRR11_05805 [Gammaproteobacteria bacterium]|nr:MAG: hypothetical protein DRQ59_12975 [Gammaproteobacteria bacterium]RLA33350.1 MAG: hypothetical protein DRR11_05805 [Gammaproteobacteria bacterium]
MFRADDNIRRLGYIPQQPIAGRNSDGLPIGFVKDDNIEPFLLSKISASRLPAAIRFSIFNRGSLQSVAGDRGK